MAFRRLFFVLLVPPLLVGVASSIWALDPSSGPEDADLLKGESIDLYFYQNQFFFFDMTIPGDWHVLSTQDLLRLLRKEDPGAGYSNQSLKQSGVSYLLSISRYQPAQRGPRGESNPNIVIHAWDLSRLLGIKTAKDYIEFMKETMKAMHVTPASGPHPVQLGGVEFWRVDGTSRLPEFRLGAHRYRTEGLRPALPTDYRKQD